MSSRRDSSDGNSRFDSLRRLKRNKFHVDAEWTVMLPTTTHVSTTRAGKSIDTVEQKSSSKGKRLQATEDDRKTLEIQNSIATERNCSVREKTETEMKYRKLLTIRQNYLKSRVTRIHPESPSASSEKSANEGSGYNFPTCSETPALPALPQSQSQLTVSKEKFSKKCQRSKESSANSSHMLSSERPDSAVNAVNELLSGVKEVVGKRERKAPLRHQDFISDSDDEENVLDALEPDSDLNQSQEAFMGCKQRIYYCNKCPSYFTSRRGMANHIKLHGVNKRFKCAVCDFSCNNYKTLHIHRGFHSAASKSGNESGTSVATSRNDNLTDDISGTENSLEKVSKDDRSSTNKASREFLCSECPFISRDQKRLETHFAGHRRTQGFKCSLCSYMSESAGFLKRHCDLHKPQNYDWPPIYVGIRRLRVQKDTLDSIQLEQQVRTEKSSTPAPLLAPLCPDRDLHSIIAPNKTGSGHRRRCRNRRPGLNYLCGQCGRHFKTYENRLIHRVANHPALHIPRDKYNCLLKERLNMYAAVLADTLHGDEAADKVSTSPQAVHQCAHCPFTCIQKSRLLRHENKHLVEAEHKCTCCTFSCRSTVMLKQHLRLHEKLTKPLQMPGRPKELHIDESASTSFSKVEKCNECPYTSRHICDLKAHAAMHVGKREYACGQCTYSTKRAHVLEAHLQLHIAEKEANSNSVTPLFLQKRSGEDSKNHSILRKHGKIVGERSGHQWSRIYLCRWCPYRTPICAKLFIHHRNHLGRGRFSCENCSFNTSVESKLRDHMKLHLTESPSAIALAVNRRPAKLPNGEYSCRECPFSSENYGKFWHHKQKHKKASRFRCHFCSYSANSSFYVAKHLLSHQSAARNKFAEKSSESKMEEFIVVKENDSERDNAAASVNLPNVIEKEEPKNCEIPTEISQIECPNDDKSYEFDLRRIAVKLPLKPCVVTESSSEVWRCKECPYVESDELLYKLHEGMHIGRRPHACNMCSFSSQCLKALHRHLSLHLPAHSPHSISQNRKRLLKRRHAYQSPETIKPDSKIYQCTTCSYRTSREDRFHEHRIEHVLHIQQRLTTAIKRAAQSDQRWVKPKVRRQEKRSDRQFMCRKCSFRCDTAMAYNTHIEKHGSKSFFTCAVCDYSSETRKVVDFHEANHHLELPVSFLNKNAVLNFLEPQVNLENDVDEGNSIWQKVSCCRCGYQTLRMDEFAEHWQREHRIWTQSAIE